MPVAHTRTHTDLWGTINKPPTAVFQSFQRDTVWLRAYFVCISLRLSKTNRAICRTISDIALLSLECTASCDLSRGNLFAQGNQFLTTRLKRENLCVSFKYLTLPIEKRQPVSNTNEAGGAAADEEWFDRTVLKTLTDLLRHLIAEKRILFLSHVEHKFVKICVCAYSYFAPIHPPDMVVTVKCIMHQNVDYTRLCLQMCLLWSHVLKLKEKSNKQITFTLAH